MERVRDGAKQFAVECYVRAPLSTGKCVIRVRCGMSPGGKVKLCFVCITVLIVALYIAHVFSPIEPTICTRTYVGPEEVPFVCKKKIRVG